MGSSIVSSGVQLVLEDLPESHLLWGDQFVLHLPERHRLDLPESHLLWRGPVDLQGVQLVLEDLPESHPLCWVRQLSLLDHLLWGVPESHLLDLQESHLVWGVQYVLQGVQLVFDLTESHLPWGVQFILQWAHLLQGVQLLLDLPESHLLQLSLLEQQPLHQVIRTFDHSGRLVRSSHPISIVLFSCRHS